MNKIVFAYTEETPRSRYLLDLLKDDFDIVTAPSCDAITKLLHESFDEMDALIIDHPSDKSDLDRLFRYVKEHNSYLFTLPILILTDEEFKEADDKYLSDLVVGMITLGDTKGTVIQRIKNVIAFTSSQSFDEFSAMLEFLPSQIYVKDARGRYAFCTKHWHHYQKSKESIRGLTDLDVRKSAENARIAQEKDREVVETGKGVEYVIKESDDEGDEYLQVIKEPLKDADGKVRGIIAIINNITDSELLRQELRQKSITDQLTGLYNRFYFEEITAKGDSSLELPLTFVSADCDGLKTINDKFGHSAGDAYICLARDAIQSALPEGAYLFRMGGDEFLAVIPKTNRETGAKIVEAIKANTPNFKTDRFALNLSVGSYTIEREGDSIEAAVNRSDKAMYRMKKRRKRFLRHHDEVLD